MAGIGIEGVESQVAQVVTITVDRPEAGESLTVEVTQGLRIVLDFDPTAAGYAIEGDDFVLSLEDGGQVVFSGLVSAAAGGDVPTIQVAGTDIAADLLIEQIQALGADAEVEPIETAAGEEGEGEEAADGGISRYDDSFGDLIAGLIEQGVIGETELDFGLIGNGGTEFLIETEFLSDGSLFGDSGGLGSLGVGDLDGPDTLAGSEAPGSGVAAPDSLPDLALVADAGEVVASYTINVESMDIITNEANGNLQIPDELILYIADARNGAGESIESAFISGPGYDGAVDNAHIWNAGGMSLSGSDSMNTWADDGNGNVRFHIGGVGPFYEGSLTYEVSDGSGGTGVGDIGVVNVATSNVASYWTLDRSASTDDEILLGQDGRNQIDGGSGDDIIHGGHDSGGDILRGGDGNDVIFGGQGNDDLQGGAGADTFLISAGFGRDDIDGGDSDFDNDGKVDDIDLDGELDIDIISLGSLLTEADVEGQGAVDGWLTLTLGSVEELGDGSITLSVDAAGIIDLGGGNVITFENIEQIDYALVG